MYTPFQLAKKYVCYYLKATNSKGHGMHSPFVFRFILYVLNNKKGFHPPSSIEAVRLSLLKNNTSIKIEDMGAGSRRTTSAERKVGDIARAAVKPKKYSHLLYRMVQYYQPQTIIELGTSLGITTAYLATANPLAEVITIEGSPAIYEMAKNTFRELSLANVQPICGHFDEVLPTVLKTRNAIGFGYIDGNHRLHPTLHYFQQFLEKSGNDTILVFDDIHWSREMEKAWAAIKQHPKVTCTIDLFFMGFVFFRQEFKEKQHFTIRY